MLNFGSAATYQSDANFEYVLSGDKQAVTLLFNGLEAKVDGGKTAPIATREFSAVLPLEGDDKKAEVAIRVTATVITRPGSTATLVFDVNGQTKFADFAAGTDDSSVQELRIKAEPPSECRLSVFLVAQHDSKDASGAVFLGIPTIDAEIQPSQ